MLVASAFALMAQVDPEYVIPKENPFAAPADVKIGDQVFQGQCAGCHGPKGEGGKGAVLAQPRLRHAPEDSSLFLVIRDGVKGTEMPGGYALTTRETWQVAAYVRSLGRLAAENVPGDSALLDPEKALPEGFMQVRLVTKDGKRINGVRLAEDTFTIQVRDMSGSPHSFVKQELKELQRDAGKSPMPSFKATLSAAEMDDLVAYLVSLRGKL
jgi:putative heme-binding domain-containing protein